MSGRPTAEMCDRLRQGKGLSNQEHEEIADRLAELDTELAEIRRRIQLIDDLHEATP